jgi:serine protease AprX
MSGTIARTIVAVGTLFAVLGTASATQALGQFPGSGRPTRAQLLDPDLLATLAATDVDQSMIVFVHSDTIEAATRAADTAGLELVERWARIGVAVAAGNPDAIRRLAADPSVSYVEPNRQVEWALDSAHIASRAQEARGPASGLFNPADLPYDGTGVTIAINDSGIDALHPMFVENGTSKVVRNLRQMCHSAAPCNEWIDVDNSDVAHGHGNSVAGAAAGFERIANNGRTVRGAAPGAMLVGLGSGATPFWMDGVLSGLNWVLENHLDPCGDRSCPPIRVVNNSWGPPGDLRFNPDAAASKLSDQLVAAGVVVVFAAMNNGGDGSVNQVNAYAQNPTPGVIGVANYDDAGMGSRDYGLHPSSSRGLKTDPTTYPDLAAPGSGITSACTYTAPYCRTLEYDQLDIDPYYATSYGTSLSAPYVAGVAALLLEANPALTPAEIEFLLEHTAYQFGPADYVTDPRNPNHTTSYDRGHGLIDVTAVLAAVLDRPAPAGPVCDGSGVIVDPEGDATDVVLRTGLPPTASDRELDITQAWVSTDPSTGDLRFTVRVADLLPPPSFALAGRTVREPMIGDYFRFYFTYRGTRYELHMERLSGPAEESVAFSLQTSGAVRDVIAEGLQGDFDHQGNVVWAVVPSDAFKGGDPALPVITTGDILGSLEVLSQRRAAQATLTADSAVGGCPYIVGS